MEGIEAAELERRATAFGTKRSEAKHVGSDVRLGPHTQTLLKRALRDS